MEKSDKILNQLATNLGLKIGELEARLAILSVELQEEREHVSELEKQLQQNEEE